MILPSKHLSQERALLTVGARILQRLSQPMTVSAVWADMQQNTTGQIDKPALRYDAFVLAIDLLYLLGAIELQNGLLSRKTQ